MSKEYVRCTGGARAHLLAPGGITATVSKGGARHGGSENRLKTKIAALLGRAQKPTKTTYCATRRKRFICECARGTVSLALLSGVLSFGGNAPQTCGGTRRSPLYT